LRCDAHWTIDPNTGLVAMIEFITTRADDIIGTRKVEYYG
jgi:hypothetical protein